MSAPNTEMKRYSVALGVIPLVEAEFDKEKREVKAIALCSGWSKNKNYYSKKIAESLATFLMEKGKMYVNHQLRPGDKKYIGGRDMRDWAAQIQEAWGEDGKCRVRFHVFEEPDGWLYERAEKCPAEIGLSIDAQAKVRYGEVAGDKGRIVEQFVKVNSLDFVHVPSAGGKAEHVVEGVDEIVFDNIIVALKEMDKTKGTELFEKFLEEIMESEDPKEVITKFLQEISKTEYESIEYPKEAYVFAPDPKKSDTWRYRVKSFDDGKLEYNKHKLYESLRSFLENITHGYGPILEEDIIQIKNGFITAFETAGLKLPSILVTKSPLDEAVIKEGLKEIENILKEGKFELIEDKTGGEDTVDLKELKLDDLLTGRPDLIDAMKEVFENESKSKEELEALNETAKTQKEEIEKKDKENDTLKLEVDEYKVKEKKAEKAILIAEKVKDLPEELKTETFMEQLEKAEDDETIDKLIADRKQVLESKTGDVEGNGLKGKQKDKDKNKAEITTATMAGSFKS